MLELVSGQRYLTTARVVSTFRIAAQLRLEPVLVGGGDPGYTFDQGIGDLPVAAEYGGVEAAVFFIVVAAHHRLIDHFDVFPRRFAQQSFNHECGQRRLLRVEIDLSLQRNL